MSVMTNMALEKATRTGPHNNMVSIHKDTDLTMCASSLPREESKA